MDKCIYSLHNGKLVYQLRKGGIFYDGKTHSPIVSKYQRAKESARNKAIKWQYDFDGKCLSWGEIANWQDYFYALAKRYGLVKEFRENGII